MDPDRTVELRDPADLDALRGPWRELVRRIDGSYFQLPDWALAWWQTVGGRAPTTVAVWHGDDGLEAVAAVSRLRTRVHRRIPLRTRSIVITGSGVGGADHLALPSTPERQRDVERWVESLRGGSIVLANLAPGQVPRLGGPRRLVETEVCPRMAIGPGTTIGRSSGYRRQVRAKVRKATEAGVTFRYLPPGELRPQHLSTLMDLHERRWQERDGESSFDRSRLGLHRRLIELAGDQRGPAAVLAEHDGATIAMVYGFVWCGTFSFFQSGWEPAWASLGLGTVVHAAAFELLGEAGVTTYDFLRGDEEYKYRFGATDVIDTTVTVPRGPGGQLLRVKHRLRARRRSG